MTRSTKASINASANDSHALPMPWISAVVPLVMVAAGKCQMIADTKTGTSTCTSLSVVKMPNSGFGTVSKSTMNVAYSPALMSQV